MYYSSQANEEIHNPETTLFKSLTLCAFIKVFVGLVTRDNLLTLLRKALVRASSSEELLTRPELSYEDLNQQFITAAARHMISQQQQAALQVFTFCCS